MLVYNVRKISAKELKKNFKKGQQKLQFYVGKSIIKIYVTYDQYYMKLYITYLVRFLDFHITHFSQQMKMNEIIMHYY